MLNQQTLEKLHALRLQGMAAAFRAQAEQGYEEELCRLFRAICPVSIPSKAGGYKL